MIDQVIEFYDNYIEQLSIVNNRHRRVFDAIDKLIPPNISVLDIGCGAGLTSKHLASGNRDVVAVDLSPALIDFARKHNNHDKIQYIVSDIINLDQYGVFDAVIMVDVLEHILLESVPTLFTKLQELSYDDTRIYLNIPSGDVIGFLETHSPDLLQIVDNPIHFATILQWFSGINFVPAYFQLYWQQYVECLFITKRALEKSFFQIFKLKE